MAEKRSLDEVVASLRIYLRFAAWALKDLALAAAAMLGTAVVVVLILGAVGGLLL